MTVLLGAVLAVTGALVVGPLVNHSVVRWTGWRAGIPLVLGFVPTIGEVGRPPGRCRRCSAPLGRAGLPAIEGLSRRGRCGSCGEPLARRYAVVECICGALWGITGLVMGWSVVLVPVLALVTGLVAMSTVDLVLMRIPTRFVYVTAATFLAGIALVAVVDGPGRRLWGAAVGGAVFGLFLLVMHLASPRSLGFGDVRLGTLVGAAAGWSAWRPDHPVLSSVQGVVSSAFLAGVVGAAAGLVLLAVRRRDRPFPFGPALAVGGLVVTLASAGASV